VCVIYDEVLGVFSSAEVEEKGEERFFQEWEYGSLLEMCVSLERKMVGLTVTSPIFTNVEWSTDSLMMKKQIPPSWITQRLAATPGCARVTQRRCDLHVQKPGNIWSRLLTCIK
jgi:hypothetical protein